MYGGVLMSVCECVGVCECVLGVRWVYMGGCLCEWVLGIYNVFMS